MDKRLLTLFFLLTVSFSIKAQDKDYARADSISASLLKHGEWDQLLRFCDTAIAKGTDFLPLYERIGYVRFVRGDYKGALSAYDHVLQKDSYDFNARYYSYYCNQYLNNAPGASVNAAYLDSATLKNEHLNKYGLVSAVVETSVKIPQSNNRGAGIYSRVGLSNRIGWRFQLEQSLTYFTQNLSNSIPFFAEPRSVQYPSSDKQFEYYVKGMWSLTDKFTLLEAYHYLNTSYLNTTYNSNIGFIGFNYTGSRYVDLQGNVSFGNIFNLRTTQYDAQLIYYPRGNLNLYTITKGSVKNSGPYSNFIFHQALGFKLLRKTWLEGSVTLGNLENYADADGLYVYNAIDNTKFKSGGTLFYQINLHAILQMSYTYETKYDIYKALSYGQHSVTAGLVWKF